MSVEVVKPARVYPRNTFTVYICLVGRARKCYTPFTVDTGTDTATVDAHINLSLTIAFYANNVAIELAVYLPGAGYIEVSIFGLNINFTIINSSRIPIYITCVNATADINRTVVV